MTIDKIILYFNGSDCLLGNCNDVLVENIKTNMTPHQFIK